MPSRTTFSIAFLHDPSLALLLILIASRDVRGRKLEQESFYVKLLLIVLPIIPFTLRLLT
jgi:hypothetical protein